MSDERFKIDEETAELEFIRFCESWEIDFDESSFNEDEKKDYGKLKRQIIKAIRLGRLMLEDDNNFKYIISEHSPTHAGKEIKIKLPEGDNYLSMNGYKETQGVSMNFALLGAVIGKPPQFVSKLSGIDLKPIQAIVTLFLAE